MEPESKQITKRQENKAGGATIIIKIALRIKKRPEQSILQNDTRANTLKVHSDPKCVMQQIGVSKYIMLKLTELKEETNLQ